MLCYLLLMAIPPAFTITVTTNKPEASEVFTTYRYNSYFNDICKMGPQDETGSYLIQQATDEEDKRDLFCDDFWTDYEADILCKNWNFKFGRRAAQTFDDAKERYYDGVPHCYLWGIVGEYRLYSGEANCGTYPPQDCANDMAAAVYCWDEEYYEHYQYISKSSSKKKWTLEFQIFIIKQGKKYNVIGEESLVKNPKSKDFKVKACDKSISVALSIDKKSKSLKLKGNWGQKCNKCLEFFYEQKRIFADECLKKTRKKKATKF